MRNDGRGDSHATAVANRSLGQVITRCATLNDAAVHRSRLDAMRSTKDASQPSMRTPNGTMLEPLQCLLDRHFDALSNEPELSDFLELVSDLEILYDIARRDDRFAEFASAIRGHALSDMLQEDPYTRRAVEKPRGYPGDAVMLDYIYRPRDLPLSERARTFHSGTTTTSTSRSILWRQGYLANLIERTAVLKPDAWILSVASGHLRELDLAKSLLHSSKVSIVALDNDGGSLDEARRANPSLNIETVNLSIANLLKERQPAQVFDLVYSAGLSDYLSDRLLSALLANLYGRLAPGGLLSLANFAPEAEGRGYLEFVMDWRLIYRDERDLGDLVQRAVPDADYRTFRDSEGGVVYVEIRAPAVDGPDRVGSDVRSSRTPR